MRRAPRCCAPTPSQRERPPHRHLCDRQRGLRHRQVHRGGRGGQGAALRVGEDGAQLCLPADRPAAKGGRGGRRDQGLRHLPRAAAHARRHTVRPPAVLRVVRAVVRGAGLRRVQASGRDRVPRLRVTFRYRSRQDTRQVGVTS
eukprot:4444582-Prymnesium_polylepis.1